MGIASPEAVTGAELHVMSDRALAQRAERTDVFAEVEPNQKERIILALRKAGHVVGFLGDGINDASALHAADVGISVESAVDVAKEAAEIVLLEHDQLLILLVIRTRRAFFRSRPSWPLEVTTVLVMVLSIAVLYLPVNRFFELEPLPLPFLALIGVITLAYAMASEAAKGWFFRREGGWGGRGKAGA